MSVIDEIAAERRRQVEVEGWTASHDDWHDKGEMALAGACYAHPNLKMLWPADVPKEWPWEDKWWKPKGRRRDLIRAAALIVAEVERLDRATPAQPQEPAPESE